MAVSGDPIDICGPMLVFGGPYSNLQAFEAVLAEAERRFIPPGRIVCTGDIAAYCSDAAATIDRVRAAGIHVVGGNCDEALAQEADTCACGFPEDSTCAQLSATWFAHADTEVRADQRAWLAALPDRLDLTIGGARLAVVHAGFTRNNEFIFASTPDGIKQAQLDGADGDGVIAGHCGLPFTEVVGGRLWHNAGVIGMPANDGTPRTWYSVFTPVRDGLEIAHAALDYDHAGAIAAMERKALLPEYRRALATGLWPGLDILPPAEVDAQGTPLVAGRITWSAGSACAGRAPQGRELLWPRVRESAGRPRMAIG